MARIFVFAFDLTEASQIRRIRSLQQLGHCVRSAAFDRKNMNAEFKPDWPHIDLGVGQNERYGRRALGLLAALWRLTRNKDPIGKADLIIARNIDLLALAIVARILTGRRDVPLVYECLDIHRLFTKKGPVGAIMRRAERWMLSKTQLLVTSSPGFISEYFERLQGYEGRYSILENKLWFADKPVPRPSAPRLPTPEAPLSLGWVGSIRCAPSLNLLLAVADQLGPRIEINIHGNIHRHALPDFDAKIATRRNVNYHGAYAYPSDLGTVYRSCDLVWAQDLWQRGANSDWLLPNRIYEASWFGCPSVAVSDTQTGRRVAQDGLGFVIKHPTPEVLCELLVNLQSDEIARVAANILAKDDANFVLSAQEVAEALAPVLVQPANLSTLPGDAASQQNESG